MRMSWVPGFVIGDRNATDVNCRLHLGNAEMHFTETDDPMIPARAHFAAVASATRGRGCPGDRSGLIGATGAD